LLLFSANIMMLYGWLLSLLDLEITLLTHLLLFLLNCVFCIRWCYYYYYYLEVARMFNWVLQIMVLIVYFDHSISFMFLFSI
jgi:hypothetical protein